MTIEELIYQILKSKMPEFITTKELAVRLEIKDERQLRATGENSGILEHAKAYAYNKYQKLIVTNYKGIRMFDNPKEALQWTAKKQKRLRAEVKSINKEIKRANQLLNLKTQTTLELIQGEPQ